MEVRVSAPKTTPPSNSMATRVVPVDTSFGAHSGNSGRNIFVSLEEVETIEELPRMMIGSCGNDKNFWNQGKKNKLCHRCLDLPVSTLGPLTF